MKSNVHAENGLFEAEFEYKNELAALRAALETCQNSAAALWGENAAIHADNAKLRELIQQVLDTDESDAAGGGEMWYAEQICETVKNVRVAFNSTTPNPLYASAPEMLEALIRAKKIIRGWHSIGHNDESEQEMWRIYDEMSPEMKPINSAIAKAKGETAQS